MKNSVKYFLYALCVVILTGCVNDNKKYDGLVLTDNKTGGVYLLRHNIGDTYMIYEKVTTIINKDTTEVFK